MPKRRRLALAYDPLCKKHRPGPTHPERPERVDACLAGVVDVATAEDIVELDPAAVTDAELTLCHTREYVDLARREIAAGRWCLSTGDTDICEGSWDAASAAVGLVLEAVDTVFGGEADVAFCPVRPPGHHATPTRGMGFCVFNNVAIGVRYVQRKYKLERVVVIDWDVHHGNGTQETFYEDPSVFYFSTHQSPLYPGTGRADETGKGPGKGTTMNCPVPRGAGRDEILGAMREKLVPAMAEFKPQAVFVSAGFDGHRDDPIGGLRLTDDDFADITRLCLELADTHAGGRLISVLEGGYNLTALMASVAAHTSVLIGKI